MDSTTQDGAVRLQEIAFTGGTLQLTPRSPAGMAVRAQIVQSQPAALITADMGTRMPRSVNHTGASVGRGHRLGSPRRRRLRMMRVVCTRGTRGALRETLEGLGLIGTFALALAGDRFGWLW